jgi:tRNA G18 (ribose-2'-O)-methylase SpoU
VSDVSPQPVAAADDVRLEDYRDLTNIPGRRKFEGDEFFICEGPVAIERLFTSGHRIRSALVLHEKVDRLQQLFSAHGVDAPLYSCDRDVMLAVTGFDLHRGVIAAADRKPIPKGDERHKVLAGLSKIAVLEGLNDPENLGAIARSAHALGVQALILDDRCMDPYTRRSVRVSMGEVLHVPTMRFDGADDLRSLLNGWTAWALTPSHRADDIWQLEVPERLALMLGAEGPGLLEATMSVADRRVRIPLNDDVDSLNVGNAAAAAFAIVGRPSIS